MYVLQSTHISSNHGNIKCHEFCDLEWAHFAILLGFNVAFKHLRSYCEGACLSHLEQCAATQECHETDTGFFSHKVS